ncbi:putative minor capsid protein [Mesobacillus subterraneus]|uniref:putative minor capsid protein n=1 Tax=Mesobacillus subterraneus TaxID=285983 RepID=UPI001CFD3A9C|nr:putative minor capsid protein [Mesobacillus subterraneus]WLR54837.1 putative minor capsid protein [Mesobacillus subterraneus]
MVKPIPRHVLIHTVTYEEFQQGDGINTEDGFKPSVTLMNVRVQSLSNIRRNSTAEGIEYDAILFFDVAHSLSTGSFEFVEKSKVIFNGKVMLVEKVNPVVANELHHYEIGMK